MPTDNSDHSGTANSVSFYLARAREQLRCAEKEPLIARKRVHMAAANRWLQLAETARHIERRAQQRIANAACHAQSETA
ncbi:MAG: hypothetical protein EON59_08435 [Alphaproteobacteria bacterium]|nr:MAG: hypothetical protein EON59_08435 [Alphaproteobacteria bacterium]